MNYDNLKPGYQGKSDSMREKAERLMNHPGHVVDNEPANAIDKIPMRKFAAGGVAKIRHGQATAAGLPKNPKKKPYNNK